MDMTAQALQCFSLYTYESVTDDQIDLFAEAEGVVVGGYRRRDNITGATLTAYHGCYEDRRSAKRTSSTTSTACCTARRTRRPTRRT